MVRHTSDFYFLLLSIFTVSLQLESISSKKIKKVVPDKDETNKLFLYPGKLTSTIDVAGFDLSEDEIKKFNIWPDGFVPYYIDVISFNDKVLRDKIRSFLNMVNSITALNFVELPSPPTDNHTRWVFFINRQGLLGCADHSVWNFTYEGVQRVVLGYDCLNKEGELPQAVLAIAGVPAQHTAPNRDDYIQVFVDNVVPEKRKLFDKLTDSEWLFHDVPYDYESVGHYHNFKYSMNGKTVIQPRNPDINIGENKELSKIDIFKIQLLYNFITQKKQLAIPVCKKLFKVGSKFENFVPGQIIAKPQRKPDKYTGVQNKENNTVDYMEPDVSKTQTDESTENKGAEDSREELSTEKSESIVSFSYSEGDEGSDQKIYPKTKLSALGEKKVNNGNDQKIYPKKKLSALGGKKGNYGNDQKVHPKKKEIASRGKKENGGEVRLLKLKVDDPLQYLSDYDSDKENEKRKQKIEKEKLETLIFFQNQSYVNISQIMVTKWD